MTRKKVMLKNNTHGTEIFEVENSIETKTAEILELSKKEFLDFLKKAKKQKEIGLWLITEPAVGSNTKKEELLGAAVSVPDAETVFYALKREQEPEGQLSLFEEVKQTVDETA